MTPGRISRRRLLGALGAGGAVALAGCAGGDGDGADGNGDETEDGTGTTTADQPEAGLTVGVLQDLSGPNGSEFGHQGISGFLSGLAYKDGGSPLELPENLATLDGETLSTTVDGTSVALPVRDTRSDPLQAQTRAVELIDAGADVLFGFSSSDSLTRFANLSLDEFDVPLLAGQASAADVTSDGRFCHPQLFRATETTAMSARAGATYIAAETDTSRVAMFGADTRFGRVTLDNYRSILGESTVEIVTEEIVDTGFGDWAPKLQAVDQQDVDVVIYAMTGETGRFFAIEFAGGDYEMRAIGDMPSRLTMAPFGERLAALAEELAPGGRITRDLVEFIRFGPLTDRYHWNQYDNPINDWFTEAQIDTYGIVPDLFTSSAFVSASATVQAFEEAGEASADAIVAEVNGMSVTDTPKGENGYEFQTYNNQARSPMTVAPVWPGEHEHWPVQVQPGEPVTRIPKAETTIPADDPSMSCDLS